MKFLLSHEYPFHMGYGGGHMVVRGLARALVKLGHEVCVCSSGNDELGVIAADAPVRYLLSGHYNRYTTGFETMLMVLKAMREIRPDWICCLTSEAVAVVPLCRLTGIKTAFYAAAPFLHPFFVGRMPALRIIRYNLELFLSFLGAKSAKKCLTISDYASRQAKTNWSIKETKIFTVGAGIDEIYITSDVKTDSISESGLRFISVGRLTLNQKPLDLMAEALATLPASWQRWTIVGSGGDEQRLRARITALGITDKTTFLGTQNSVQIAALLDEHDIALLPSNYESFFLTAYEAAAKGKIIVTNDVADIRHYFTSSPSVVIADNAKPAAYRQAIVYAIENFGRLQSTATETAGRVKHDYNWIVVAERFLQALR